MRGFEINSYLYIYFLITDQPPPPPHDFRSFLKKISEKIVFHNFKE